MRFRRRTGSASHAIAWLALLFAAGVAQAQLTPTTRLPASTWPQVMRDIDAARQFQFTDPAQGIRQLDSVIGALARVTSADDGLFVHALNARAAMRLQLAQPQPAQIGLALQDIERGLQIARLHPTGDDMHWLSSSLLMSKTTAIDAQPDPAPGMPTKYDQALPFYREALAVAPAATSPLAGSRWNAHGNFANAACANYDNATCRQLLGDFAREARVETLSAREQLQFHRLTAWLGAFDGDWAGAAVGLEASARLLRQCNGPLDTSSLLGIHQLAYVFIYSGATRMSAALFDALERCLNATGAPFDSDNPSLLAASAQAWAAIAETRLAAGRVEEAARALEASSRYMDALFPYRQDLPLARTVLNVYRRIGAEVSAEGTDMRLAIQNLEGVADGSCAYDSALLARLYVATGQQDKARDRLEAGFSKLGKERLCEYSDWRFFIEAAHVFDSLRDGSAAIALGKEAILRSEQTRQSFEAGQRSTFARELVGSRAGIYQDTAAWLIGSNRTAEALLILGLLRDREIEELSRGAVNSGSAAPERLMRPDELRARQRLAQGGPGALAASLSLLDRETRASSHVVSNTHLAAGDVELVAVPSGDTLALELFGPEGRLECSPGTIKVPQVDTRAAALAIALSNASGTAWRSQARWMHDRIWVPVRDCVRRHLAATGTVRLQTRGALRSVPFGALLDGDHFLVEQYAFAIAPDGTVAAAISNAGRRGLASFGADTTLNGMALKFAESEARGIAQVFGGPNADARVYVARAFTRDALLHSLADPTVGRLHVATHFELPTAGLPVGRLLLGDGSSLFAADLARQKVAGLQLLVLSACDTAREAAGGSGSPGELDGFAGMLRRQGVDSVVASLWRVNDQSAPALMKDFYSTLRADPSRDVARALRAAQARMARTASPYYWAPFIALGGTR
jgi:tetratricopeptide (TPR) repeat protein